MQQLSCCLFQVFNISMIWFLQLLLIEISTFKVYTWVIFAFQRPFFVDFLKDSSLDDFRLTYATVCVYDKDEKFTLGGLWS